MSQITKEITVDVSKKNHFEAVVAKQHDANSRFLKVTLCSEGEKLMIPPSSSAVLNVRRADGEANAFVGTVNPDGTVTVPLASWALGLDDIVSCSVSVFGEDGERLTSTSFTVNVEAVEFTGEAIPDEESEDMFTQLMAAAANANSKADEAKTAAASANEAAGRAYTAADKADSAAARADSCGRGASEAATEALEQADLAGAAAARAETASASANTAIEEVNKAKSDAETATANANAAASSANTAADKANRYAAQAQGAASAASEAASAAGKAVAAANSAKSAADTAADKANAAAAAASTAADNANSKAAEAVTAAGEANAAAEAANEVVNSVSPDVAQLKTDMSTVTDLVSHNHRTIYRGKSLGNAVTDEQKSAISSGSFDDIYIGDYWAIDGVNWVVADMDYFYQTGDTAFKKHHLVIVPRVFLYQARMNPENTTEGGYVGSEMYTTNLEEAKEKIRHAFGDMVLTHRDALINAVANGHPTGYIWADSTVELMTEVMVYGTHHCSVMNAASVFSIKYTTARQQFALFALDPYDAFRRQNFWLRDVVSSAFFAYTVSSGVAHCGNAAGTRGVRPYFCIG